MIQGSFIGQKIYTSRILSISFVNLTTISPSQMIDYSPLHPFGEKYALEQIQEVETGFYGSRLIFLYDKGDFYYQIKFKNGKTISIGDCYTLPLYEKHTYSELVEMDRLIMQYKPHKISSDKNFEYIQMDQEYIDRFLSIVNNQ